MKLECFELSNNTNNTIIPPQKYSTYVITGKGIINDSLVLNKCILTKQNGLNVYLIIQAGFFKVAIETESTKTIFDCYYKYIETDDTFQIAADINNPIITDNINKYFPNIMTDPNLDGFIYLTTSNNHYIVYNIQPPPISLNTLTDITNLNFNDAYNDISKYYKPNLDEINNTITNYAKALYWDINFLNINTCYAIININRISESISDDYYDIYNGIISNNIIIEESKIASKIQIKNNLNKNISIPSININNVGVNCFYIKIVSSNTTNNYTINFNSVNIYNKSCKPLETSSLIKKLRINTSMPLPDNSIYEFFGDHGMGGRYVTILNKCIVTKTDGRNVYLVVDDGMFKVAIPVTNFLTRTVNDYYFACYYKYINTDNDKIIAANINNPYLSEKIDVYFPNIKTDPTLDGFIYSNTSENHFRARNSVPIPVPPGTILPEITTLTFTNAYPDKIDKRLGISDNIIWWRENTLYWDINFLNTGNCYATINISDISDISDMESIRGNYYDIYNGIVYREDVIIENKITIQIINNLNSDIILPIINNNRIGINYFYIKIVPHDPRGRYYNIALNSVKLNYRYCQPIETNRMVLINRGTPGIYFHSFFNLPIVKTLYYEFIEIKNKNNRSFWNCINFNGGYVGYLFAEQKIQFSLWAVEFGSRLIRSEIIHKNKDLVVHDTGEFGAEGVNANTQMPVTININERLGFICQFEVRDYPISYKYPYGKATYVSCYYINLGDINNPNPSPTWTYMATLKYYNEIKWPTKNNLIDCTGFLECISNADTMLTTNKIAFGNAWANNGTTWVKSVYQQYTGSPYLDGTTYNSKTEVYDSDSCMLMFNHGGRIKGNTNIQLNRTNYDNQPVPAHLLNLSIQYPIFNNIDSLINLTKNIIPITSETVLPINWDNIGDLYKNVNTIDFSNTSNDTINLNKISDIIYNLARIYPDIKLDIILNNMNLTISNLLEIFNRPINVKISNLNLDNNKLLINSVDNINIIITVFKNITNRDNLFISLVNVLTAANPFTSLLFYLFNVNNLFVSIIYGEDISFSPTPVAQVEISKNLVTKSTSTKLKSLDVYITNINDIITYINFYNNLFEDLKNKNILSFKITKPTNTNIPVNIRQSTAVNKISFILNDNKILSTTKLLQIINNYQGNLDLGLKNNTLLNYSKKPNNINKLNRILKNKRNNIEILDLSNNKLLYNDIIRIFSGFNGFYGFGFNGFLAKSSIKFGSQFKSLNISNNSNLITNLNLVNYIPKMFTLSSNKITVNIGGSFKSNVKIEDIDIKFPADNYDLIKTEPISEFTNTTSFNFGNYNYILYVLVFLLLLYLLLSCI